MVDKTIRFWNRKGTDYVDVLYKDNGDGTYSQHFVGKIEVGDLNIGNVDVLTMPITHVIADPGENFIGSVGGKSISVFDAFTRVADTIALTAGDVISGSTSDSSSVGLRSLAVGRVNGGTGFIYKIRLSTEQASCVAAVKIHFFTKASPTAPIPGDNSPMTLKYANASLRIGTVTLPPFASSTVLGTSDLAETEDLFTRLQFQCDPADNKIYYRLETLTSFTPVSAQKFLIQVAVEQN